MLMLPELRQSVNRGDTMLRLLQDVILLLLPPAAAIATVYVWRAVRCLIVHPPLWRHRQEGDWRHTYCPVCRETWSEPR